MALSNAHFSHIDDFISQIQVVSVTQVSEIDGKPSKLSDGFRN